MAMDLKVQLNGFGASRSVCRPFHTDVATPRRVSVSKCRNCQLDPSKSLGMGSALEKRKDGHSTRSRVIPANLSKNKIIMAIFIIFHSHNWLISLQAYARKATFADIIDKIPAFQKFRTYSEHRPGQYALGSFLLRFIPLAAPPTSTPTASNYKFTHERSLQF